jgi:predicted ABC-type transport system involved in lysophospholipase L1 biosynthesis ATPase subunit
MADEPTFNLDNRTSAEGHELLFRLNQAHDLSMLIVTHTLELAQQMPRVVRMADGRILEGDGRDGESEPTAPG